MNIGPPPLPSAERDAEPSAFAHWAANVCLLAPLIIIGLSLTLSTVVRTFRGPTGQPLLVIFGLTAGACFLAGTVLGILAVALARRGQRVSVVVRSVCGLLLMGLLVAIAVPNFVRARSIALQRNQGLQEVRSAADQVRAQTVESLTNGGQGSVDTGRLQRSLAQAAEKSSGGTAAVLKSTQNYLARMQAYQQAYKQAADELLAAKVLFTGTLTQRAQIQDRKVVVQKFLDANNAFTAFLLNGEAAYRQELAAYRMTEAQREAALKGFRKDSAAQSPLLVRIREADDRMGHAMLGLLDLLDAQWGQWNYEPAAKLVQFQDPVALEQFNDLLADLKRAGVDQAAAQKRLASALSQPAASR